MPRPMPRRVSRLASRPGPRPGSGSHGHSTPTIDRRGRVASAGLLALALVLAGCGGGPDAAGGATAGGEVATAAPDTAAETGGDGRNDAATPAPAAPSSADLPDLGTPPALVDLDGWLNNGDVEGLDDTRGRVTVVWFWTFGCFNCKNTIPNLQQLRAAHPQEDVAFISVHAPEFEYEADTDAIRQAADDQGVTWPIALDTDHVNFRAWQEGTGNFWPRTFVLDQAGQIRFDHIGEGGYETLNDTVATLVADPVPSDA